MEVTVKKLILDRSIRSLFFSLRRKLGRQKRLLTFDQEHPCVFVLSTGRAGTQTLSALLGLTCHVFVYHEPFPKLYGLSKLSYQFSEEPCVAKVLQEAFQIARKELLQYSLSCGRGYIETSPQVTFLLPVIVELIPGVKFIHLVRDPRDVVRSGMRRQWYNGNQADPTRIVPLVDSQAGQHWNNYTPFEKNLWLWAETNQWILDRTAMLPADRILLLHAKDLFATNADVFTRLFNFIGAPPPSKRRLLNILEKRLNAQKTGIFPDASTWDEDTHVKLVNFCGGVAAKLGYAIP